MVEVAKKCIECGREFITVWDKKCDTCQMKHPKVWELREESRIRRQSELGQFCDGYKP